MVIIITQEADFSAKMAMRLLFLVIGTTLVTLTTTPMHLTDGMESLMSPLKLIKFPVHDVAIIMSIALRFIPSLMEEIDKIMLAQKARGAAFDTAEWWQEPKALLPVSFAVWSAFARVNCMALDASVTMPRRTAPKMKALKLRYGRFGAVFCAAL